MEYRVPTPQVTDFAPPVYYCRKTAQKPIIDGNLDKPFWQEVPFTADFVDIEGEKGKTPRFRTRAKMRWDADTLYVGAELMGNEIWAHVTQHDDVIFSDNDFEIFIDPDSDTHCYCEFEMNARNTTWDLLLTKPYRDGGQPLNSLEIKGLQTAVGIDGTLNDPNAKNIRWTVEIAMPIQTIMECCQQREGRLTPGQFWRVGFSRVQWIVDIINGQYVKRTGANGAPLPEDNWVWAPTGLINMHYPELWGFVFFCENDEEYPIPEDEYRKWELRKLYYAQHACYDETGAFDPTLTSTNPQFSSVVQVCDHSFVLSCPSADGKGTLILYADGRTERK